MERKKHILIFNPGPIFPIYGMNMVRVFNQIKGLSEKHEVHFMFTYSNKTSKLETINQLKLYCKEVIPVKTISNSFFYKALRKLFLARFFKAIAFPLDYFHHSNRISAKKVANVISKSRIKYDVLITHYWQSAGFLRYLEPDILKSIDTHYLVQENLELYEQGAYSHLGMKNMEKLLKRELKFQNEYFELCDFIIVNSMLQKDILQKSGSDREILFVPNGQNLNYYLNSSKRKTTELNLLFYGALSSQFNEKALKRIIKNILPELRILLPGIKFTIMGKNPPKWLQKIAETDNNIHVTGFVEDVRKVFAESFAALIPLESGSGFRSITVELLAAGVPVIGTHNALDSVGLTNGKNGFIFDSDKEIINCVVKLAKSPELRSKISREGQIFASENYSIEATFGKLGEYFLRTNYEKK
jgi:glycosyltransferase involved in cell wall biosynthesis